MHTRCQIFYACRCFKVSGDYFCLSSKFCKALLLLKPLGKFCFWPQHPLKGLFDNFTFGPTKLSLAKEYGLLWEFFKTFLVLLFLYQFNGVFLRPFIYLTKLIAWSLIWFNFTIVLNLLNGPQNYTLFDKPLQMKLKFNL